MTDAREIRLKSRPNGLPASDNFELVSLDLPAPGPGEVQVRNTWMTVDPYMRGRMNDVKSYVPPFQLGQALQGGAIGEVVESNAPGFKAGDLVQSNLGWRTAFNAPADQVQKLDVRGLPPQAFLGVAGMPGLTAYAGLLRVAALKEGDVVFVSGAAGAVGSVVCQIAKARGHTVIGSAGGPEKCAWVKALGADAVIDYKAEPIVPALAKAAPKGIDVYFDNVGGEHLDAAFAAARQNARFAICGMIDDYNTGSNHAFRYIMRIIAARIMLKGFIYTDYLAEMGDFYRDMGGWIASGQVTSRETVRDGIEAMPEAFLDLFRGANIGKMLVRL